MRQYAQERSNNNPLCLYFSRQAHNPFVVYQRGQQPEGMTSESAMGAMGVGGSGRAPELAVLWIVPHVSPTDKILTRIDEDARKTAVASIFFPRDALHAQAKNPQWKKRQVGDTTSRLINLQIKCFSLFQFIFLSSFIRAAEQLPPHSWVQYLDGIFGTISVIHS